MQGALARGHDDALVVHPQDQLLGLLLYDAAEGRVGGDGEELRGPADPVPELLQDEGIEGDHVVAGLHYLLDDLLYLADELLVDEVVLDPGQVVLDLLLVAGHIFRVNYYVELLHSVHEGAEFDDLVGPQVQLLVGELAQQLPHVEGVPTWAGRGTGGVGLQAQTQHFPQVYFGLAVFKADILD